MRYQLHVSFTVFAVCTAVNCYSRCFVLFAIPDITRRVCQAGVRLKYVRLNNLKAWFQQIHHPRNYKVLGPDLQKNLRKNPNFSISFSEVYLKFILYYKLRIS